MSTGGRTKNSIYARCACVFCGYSRYQLNLIINSVNRLFVLFDTLVYIDTQVRIGRTRLVVYFVRLQPVASTPYIIHIS